MTDKNLRIIEGLLKTLILNSTYGKRAMKLGGRKMIESTTKNIIKQEISINLEGEEKKKFYELVKNFVEKNTLNKIEGVIDEVFIHHQYGDTIKLNVNTIKEDKLKMLEMKK